MDSPASNTTPPSSGPTSEETESTDTAPSVDPVVWPEDPWEKDEHAASEGDATPSEPAAPVVTTPVVPAWPEGDGEPAAPPGRVHAEAAAAEPETTQFATQPTVPPWPEKEGEGAPRVAKTVPPTPRATEAAKTLPPEAAKTLPPEAAKTLPPEPSPSIEFETTPAMPIVPAAIKGKSIPPAPITAPAEAEPDSEPSLLAAVHEAHEHDAAPGEAATDMESAAEPAAAAALEPIPQPEAEATVEAKPEPVVVAKVEPAVEPKAEPAPEPKVEPAPPVRVEPAPEPKAETKASKVWFSEPGHHTVPPPPPPKQVTQPPAPAEPPSNPPVPTWAPQAPAAAAKADEPVQWPGSNLPTWAPVGTGGRPAGGTTMSSPPSERVRAPGAGSTPLPPAPAPAPPPAPRPAVERTMVQQPPQPPSATRVPPSSRPPTPQPAPAPTASNPPSQPPTPSSWEVVKQKGEEKPQVHSEPTAEDRSYAEWFAWAKRSGAPASACHAAAQGAFRALANGKDMATAVQWATLAMASPPGLVGTSRQLYCAWFSLGSIDLKLPTPQAHSFASGAVRSLEDGNDSMVAHQAGLAAAGITAG